MHKLQGSCETTPFCFCGNGIYGETLSLIEDSGIRTVILPPDADLPSPVKNHADLSVFSCGGKVIFREKYWSGHDIGRLLREHGFDGEVLLSGSTAGQVYPSDVHFCARIAGRYLICREQYTDPLCISAALENGLTVTDVRQGYCACSAAALSDGAVITADTGIARAMRKNGTDVLLISPYGIVLRGYGNGSEGFIGGCCGLYGNKLFFNGDPCTHPDSEKIFAFCEKHGTVPVFPEGLPLLDVGGLVFYHQ